MTESAQRAAVDAALQTGDAAAAVSALRGLVSEDASVRTLAFVDRSMNTLATLEGAPKRVDVAVVRAMTLDPLARWVRAFGLSHGVDIRLHFGEYDQFEQELAGMGTLAERTPDAVVLFPSAETLVPRLAQRFVSLGAEERAGDIEAAGQRVAGWLDAAESRWPKAWRIAVGLDLPSEGAFALAESASFGQRAAYRTLNAAIADACAARGNAHAFDLDGALSGVGKRNAYDARANAAARLPYSAAGLAAIAHRLARVVGAAFTKRKKCLVLDCDNTLWGGIIGEDGMEGIALGPEHPGSAYVAFQRAVLTLHDRGVILALNSKNNDADVLEVLEHHPSQVIREAHIAARRVNWQDKATNLRELAEEINIGIDSLVFVDDSDFECAWVREQVPEVTVIQAPKDPLALAALLDDVFVFDALTLSAEDLKRGQMYKAEAARRREQSTVASVDDFLASLEMELTIAAATGGSLPRVAQLTQRTNQFNLTTRRYTESDIRGFVADPMTDVYHVHLKDRFGEYGITGVVIAREAEGTLDIDTLLLSCRVLGRGVEASILAFVDRLARDRGVSRVVGTYAPTKKNAQTKTLFERFGYAPLDASEGTTRWARSTASAPLDYPDLLTLSLPTLSE